MAPLLQSLREMPSHFAFALRSLIIYDPVSNSPSLEDPSFVANPIPIVLHLSSTVEMLAINSSDTIRSYVYPSQSHGFANPTSLNYNKPATRIAYTRTLKLLRDTLGPNFDLEEVTMNSM